MGEMGLCGSQEPQHDPTSLREAKLFQIQDPKATHKHTYAKTILHPADVDSAVYNVVPWVFSDADVRVLSSRLIMQITCGLLYTCSGAAAVCHWMAEWTQVHKNAHPWFHILHHIQKSTMYL